MVGQGYFKIRTDADGFVFHNKLSFQGPVLGNAMDGECSRCADLVGTVLGIIYRLIYLSTYEPVPPPVTYTQSSGAVIYYCPPCFRSSLCRGLR